MARILIVEDERVAALSIQDSLESFHHEVIANVSSGIEALQLAVSTRPELVLMDIYLKGSLDGIQTAQRMRQLNIPIVFLTADADDQTLQRAIQAQPFGYLIKPFKKFELHTTIETTLRRHQLEQELETTKQWLSLTLNSIGDGVIATDRDGLITFINPTAADLTEWSPAEAMGQAADQVLQLIHPDTRAAMENPCRQAMQRGLKTTLSEPCLLRSRHGTERWVGDSAAPIRQASGEIVGSIMVFQDITDRRETERLLHRREQEFRALVEHSPDIIARFDSQLRYVYINPTIETITGIPVSAFVGRTNRDLEMPVALSEIWETAIQTVFSQRQEQSIEFDMLTLEGWRSFQTRLVPELAPDHTVESVLSVSRDITDSKRTQDSLRQQAEREALIRGITQRIRQSLNLDDVLNTTVQEVRQFLQADRVVIYRFQPDWSGVVVVESLSPGWTPMLGRKIFDACLIADECITPYTEGYVGRTNNTHAAGLADCYVEILDQFQVKANLVIPILQGEQIWGLMAVQQCSTPRSWQDWEVDLLQNLAAQVSIAVYQSQLYQQTQLQAQREYALNSVIRVIRNSLDLNTIFNTAVSETGKLLQVEQAHIVRYLPSQKLWVHLASYCQNPEVMPNYAGLEVPDSENEITRRLKRGDIVRIDDTRDIEDELNQILAETFPGAWLLVPLQVSNQIWGNIGIIKGAEPFTWQDWQVELLQTLADQLAIAIQQSELYHQVQQLNTTLEEQVQERTAQLQQASNFEATLKRITDRVRDSLDEKQILQTVVHELAIAVGVDTCNAAIYNLQEKTATICYEYSASGEAFQLYTLPMSDFSEGYQQLLAGQHFQFCSYASAAQSEWVAKLVCPIVDDQGVLGDLWLIHQAEYSFSDQEIRLVLLVANQCAIALRQARLYRAAQSQVEQLEQLHSLKDDFLSTVSHELRTPMANIRMATEMLGILLKQVGVLDEAPDQSSRIQRYFQILKGEGEREINLIDDLLDLSRFDRVEPLNLTELDLTTWLPPLIASFQERSQTLGQTLRLHLPSSLPPLKTDPVCLERILIELLTNACKYTPAGERIRISTHTLHNLLEIWVSNTGAVIPEQERDRIFEKFYRIPKQDPWRHSGTGLGLALVQQLTHRLGGAVRLDSRDQETTFIVSLPLTLD